MPPCGRSLRWFEDHLDEPGDRCIGGLELVSRGRAARSLQEGRRRPALVGRVVGHIHYIVWRGTGVTPVLEVAIDTVGEALHRPMLGDSDPCLRPSHGISDETGVEATDDAEQHDFGLVLRGIAVMTATASCAESRSIAHDSVVSIAAERRERLVVREIGLSPLGSAVGGR